MLGWLVLRAATAVGCLEAWGDEASSGFGFDTAGECGRDEGAAGRGAVASPDVGMDGEP